MWIRSDKTRQINTKPSSCHDGFTKMRMVLPETQRETRSEIIAPGNRGTCNIALQCARGASWLFTSPLSLPSVTTAWVMYLQGLVLRPVALVFSLRRVLADFGILVARNYRATVLRRIVSGADLYQLGFCRYGRFHMRIELGSLATQATIYW